jgi:hypothetical protein
MAGEGLIELQEMEGAGMILSDIEEYRKTETQLMKNAGWSEQQIKEHWGIVEPNRSSIKEYWNNVYNSFKDPVQITINEEAVNKARASQDNLLKDYQDEKIDQQTFQEQMNALNEELTVLGKGQVEVLGVSGQDILDLPSDIKKSAVGDTFDFQLYLERGLSKSIYNLHKTYKKGDPLPDAFFEEPGDTGHIERAIESLAQIVPDLPVYFGGAVPGFLLTRNKIAAATSAGFVAGSIREMYIQAILDGEVDTFSEFWNIFLEEGWKAGAKEGITLGATVAFPQMLGTKTFMGNFAAQYTAFVGVGSALEQHMPTKDELINTALVLGALNVGGRGVEKTFDYIKKSNKSPHEVLEEVVIDPNLKQKIVSKNLEIKETKDIEVKETYESLQEKVIQLEKDIKEGKKPLEKIREEQAEVQKQFDILQQKETKPIETKEKITEKIEVLEKELKTLETKKPKEVETKETKKIEEDLLDIPEFLRKEAEKETKPVEVKETKEVETKNNERIIEIKNEIVREKQKLEIIEKETKETQTKEIETAEVKEIKETTDPVENVKKNISFEQPKERSTVGDFFNKMQEMFVDRLHPILQVVKVKEKKQRTVKEPLSPYEKFRIQPGIVGRAMHFITHGTLNFKDLSFRGKGFNDILVSIKEGGKRAYEDFAAFAVAKRALEKINQGFETGFNKADVIATIKKLEGKYEKIFQEFVEYQKSLLDYMLESGMVDKKLYNIITEANKDYVPFNRVIDAKDSSIGNTVFNPLKQFKGSKRQVIDPIETVYKNTLHFITMAERNSAFIEFFTFVEKNIKEFPDIKKADKKAKPIKVTKKELEKIVTDPSKLTDAVAEGFTIFRKDGHIISDSQVGFFRNGKFEVWEVGKDLATALKDMNHSQAKMLLKIIGLPSRTLRAGATLAPEFMVKNVGRDTLTAGIFSKSGTIPMLGTLQGIFHLTLGKRFGGQMYTKWIKSGGLQSMLVSMDRNYFAKNVRSEFVNTRAFNVLKNPLELLRMASELFETSTRLGEFANAYKKAKKAGLSEKQALERAGFEGRDVTVDFKKMGTQIQAFNMISAFFNARLQGYAKIFDGMKNRPLTTFTRIGMYITAPTILLWLKNHDDPRYQQLKRWEKDLFWIFITGDGTVEDGNYRVWRVPKPFELGILFGTGVEKILDMINSKHPDKVKLFLKEFTFDNLKTLGPIPDFIKPAIENWSNKSLFSNRPIVDRGLEKLLPEYQWNEYTSETAKAIGNVLRFMLGDESSWTSPQRIDSLIYNWSGTLGRHVVNMADKALIESGIMPDPVKPADTLADMPIIKAFVVRNPSLGSEHIEDFYRMYIPLKKRIDTINSLTDPIEIEKQLNNLTKKIGMESMTLISIKEALDNQRLLISLITQNKNIPPDEKRQHIDDITRMMIMIAKDAVEKIK